ncbi:hypothetical protein Mapa_007594 [Marchantia paleacea]|nr:hypothetical protein Mapa_007594 [Marchantia paleacea]
MFEPLHCSTRLPLHLIDVHLWVRAKCTSSAQTFPSHSQSQVNDISALSLNTG